MTRVSSRSQSYEDLSEPRNREMRLLNIESDAELELRVPRYWTPSP